MNEYYMEIDGVDVWVTVHRPYIFDEKADGFVPPPGFCVAFKFSQKPGMIIGETLRKGKQPRWFPTPEKARDAAFEEAKKRIKGKAKS